jgi:hypothetical protein
VFDQCLTSGAPGVEEEHGLVVDRLLEGHPDPDLAGKDNRSNNRSRRTTGQNIGLGLQNTCLGELMG